jgi:hypothetical protein
LMEAVTLMNQVAPFQPQPPKGINT